MQRQETERMKKYFVSHVLSIHNEMYNLAKEFKNDVSKASVHDKKPATLGDIKAFHDVIMEELKGIKSQGNEIQERLSAIGDIVEYPVRKQQYEKFFAAWLAESKRRKYEALQLEREKKL